MPAQKRELVTPGNDKRYVRRDDQGRFTPDQSDVGRSGSADRRQQSPTPAKHGQGDKGDRRPAPERGRR
jgi:hypothetical protein